MNSINNKRVVLSVASTIAVVLGLGAAPAFAGGTSHGPTHPSVPTPTVTSDCCSVDWSYDPIEINIYTSDKDFHLGGLSEICSTQSFTGSLSDSASLTSTTSAGVDNAVSAIANVISVNGGENAGATVRSNFPAVINAVQTVAGGATASASANTNNVVVTGANNFNSSATAAFNIADIQSTLVASLKDTQTIGANNGFATITSSATANNTTVHNGELSNTASSVGNVANLDVKYGAGSIDAVGIADLKQTAYVNMGSTASMTSNNVSGKVTNSASSIANVASLTLEAGAGGKGYALADVTQTAFANLSATSSINGLSPSGALTNTATSAANVLNIINK